MSEKKYVAFLRGINVGGHHKVPMAELKKSMEAAACNNVVTLLNSGNIIFDHHSEEPDLLENELAVHLEKHFGFPIPTIIRDAQNIRNLYNTEPFKNVEITKDIRLYISFLRQEQPSQMPLPWTSEDKAYSILDHRNKCILSVLNISISQTTKAMEILEKAYGKPNITTRNWKTIERIVKKL